MKSIKNILWTILGINHIISKLNRIDHEIIDLKKYQHQNYKEIMEELNNLNQAIATLQGTVDEAITVLNTPHPTNTAVQAAADAVNAQSARLKAALAPATPVTPPTE